MNFSLYTALLLMLLQGSLVHVRAQQTSQNPADAGAKAVMQADSAFARATAAQGLEGWMSFFAQDAVKLPFKGDIIRGYEQIRQHDAAMFEDSSITLTWRPTDGGVYEDQHYGYTRGRYELIKQAGGKPQVAGKGTYLTFWRKEKDGSWKVVMDTGVPDPEE